MKILFLVLIIIFLQNCSFDNKTGIWKNENFNKDEKENIFRDFEKFSTKTEHFNKIINIKKNYVINLPSKVEPKKWNDIHYNNRNNFDNFSYESKNNLILKSKKITKSTTSDFLLFKKNNIILSDHKGNLIIFSLDKNKVIYKFNFYKKEFKNIKKKLNYILQDDIIYVSDNLGYLYALDYNKKKILWAKNYKIPFRSNLKIHKKLIIAANQNNNLLFYDKNNGNLIKKIPTEETLVKSKFIDNLSLSNNNLFFLNTYGSLYSISMDTLNVSWFLNLNPSIDPNPNNLFYSTEIINHKGKIILSSNEFTYVIDEKTGALILKKNFIPNLKPIAINDFLFLVTKNNLLISLDLNNGNIIYSYNVNQKIAQYLDIKRQSAQFKSMAIINNKIFIFLKNKYLLIFSINGSLKEIRKLPSKLNTFPIFANNLIFYLDQKNRLFVLN